jgi:phenylacetate-CoA ligase
MYSNVLYKKSPIFVQNILLSTKELARKIIRERRSDDPFTQLIFKNEKAEKELSEYVNERLTATLAESRKDVPFYKQLGLDNSANLAAFPYLTKMDLNADPDSFKASNHKGIVVNGTTSGTMGMPLSIPQNLTSVLREQAFLARHLKWAGFEKGDKRAWIRGDLIVPLEQKQAPFWRYSYFEDRIFFSSYHLTSSALSLYIDKMADFGVDIIQAYPSSIVILAKYLDVHDKYYPGKLKSIVTSSEKLSEDDRALIEKRFNCTVFDWYGMFERVAAIANCEHGRYHILTDYSHVELSDCGDGLHEIIGTNFNNSLYPLIRYRTGDHVVLSDEQSCPCGRVYPIIDHIKGRVADYLTGEDGQIIYSLYHIEKGVDGLMATQFVQDFANEIKVLAVADEQMFDGKQQGILIENIKQYLGQSMNIVIECVDCLPKTKNGKVRHAICNI